MDDIEAMLTKQLNDAIFYNSKKIIAHLLADKNCILDHLNRNVPRPLLVAMRTGNLEIVEEVLKAGASVNARGPMHECYKTAETWPALHGDALSAIEYACYLDNTAMLRLIASYDKDKNRDGAPLHAVLHLTRGYLTNFAERSVKRFVLLTFVRVLIDAGVNVNAPDQHRHTPLNHLLKEVKLTLEDNIHIDSENFQMIVDTVEMLLTAGADPNAPKYIGRGSLHFLLYIIINYSDVKISQSESHPGNQFGKITAILALLLKHKAHISSHLMSALFCLIWSFTGIIISIEAVQSGRIANSYLSVLESDELIDGLAEMFRILLLSGGHFDMATCTTDDWAYFGRSFVVIVNQSTSALPLQNFLDFVTGNLCYSVLYQLKIRMINKEFKQVGSLVALNDEKAIEFLCGSNSPRSLQDMSRDAIIRCLSDERHLLSRSQEVLSHLKIPNSLHKYILLQK